MKSHVFVGILAACFAAGAATDVKKVQQPDSNCACEAIPNTFCPSHFFAPGSTQAWFGRFPNARRQTKEEANEEFLHFSRLLALNNYCSHVMYNLLCFHYFPQCSLSRPRLGATPCRETCEEAWTACLPHANARSQNYRFPDHLNCTNFEPSSTECAMSVSGEEDGCDHHCVACPNASIHVEFATEPATKEFVGSESTGEARIYLRLANVGSYDPEATLQEDVTVNLCPMSRTAEAGADFVAGNRTIVFPAGSRKGRVIGIVIAITRDSIEEGTEKFTEQATITSPAEGALFGGAIYSTSGSISVQITDQYPPVFPTNTPEPPASVDAPAPSPAPAAATPSPTPSPVTPSNPGPVIPVAECKNTECNWRTSVSGKTFRKNQYTFAAHVRVSRCTDSFIEVEVIKCREIVCGMCPETAGHITKVAICPHCALTDCPIGGQKIIAGSKENGSWFITDYKKKGLYSAVRSDWASFVPACREP